MASFQKKRDVLLVPVGWNIYFFPIPCYTFVVFYGLQPKRYFDVIGVPIFCIMFIFKIRVIVDASCSRCVNINIFS